MRADAEPFPLSPGILLGLGIGGLIDGILLQQILQWHHMLSGWYPPTTLENLRINTVGDGLFHALAWLLIVAGILTLWRATERATPPSLRCLVGTLLIGRGLFNLMESVIDHTLLDVPTSTRRWIALPGSGGTWVSWRGAWRW